MVTYYLDTCVYIYHLEQSPLYEKKVEPYFEQLVKNKINVIASPLVLQEILAGVYKADPDKAQEIYGLLAKFPNIEWVHYDLQIADLAAELTGNFGVRAPDAIHLATAIARDVSFFVTNDFKLPKMPLPFKIVF